ncbi:class I SAM-dependent DNA methyltransferase [Hymenobacter sp. PAMC 26628]|uniref:class I SAM-dependent DNA methyltransferase n=1 Tax=Hymenobacter sp. PAMC 26628 TaxID=1484118 RepID=UPI001F2D7912|nr:DNA methyltransferase [Hymenobacter sp. PAMC 26628]
MTYSNFETRWLRSGGAEHANYGLFLQDLCDLLDVPRPDPTTDDPTQDAYVFERGVTFDDGAGKRSTGRIDLYKRGCFVLETKQGTDTPDQQAKATKAELGQAEGKRRKGHAVRGTAKWGQMVEAAREQALRYVRALPASEPRPPFVVVVDVGFSIDLYSNFAGVGDSYVPFPDSGKFRVLLPALADPEVRARLKLLFTDPQQLDPSRLAAQVTRRLAGHLAGLSSQLEKAGHAPDVVAQFLMRCLFTMFAEDVELIPKKSFSKLLAEYADTAEARAYLPEALANLWATMDKGGFSPALRTKVRHFNGKLFHDATALPLNTDQVALLQQAAAADWTLVEPAIFGTLLERALDPAERHSLGAHYTPRRYVERLVLPAVIEPLRQEWAAAQAASTQLLEEGKGKKAVDEARAELLRFLHRLTSVRILDPACGSGNFLYVTLEHLKRLEGEVLTALGQLGQSGRLELGDGTTVGPRQLLGLELNPRAAAIADVVLRIGYLQWHLRTYGLTQLREPLLDDYQNIQQQDAVLSYDGPDFANARPAVWPEADFIVGNPPFVGASRMRDALGDAYTLALRKTYAGKVTESADLVMFWWQRAAAEVQAGRTERFGFITTNSLRQTFNRRVMQPFLDGEQPALALTFAIPDHPWVDSADGAAVRVAFTVAQSSVRASTTGQLLQVLTEKAVDGDDAAEVTFGSEEGRIQPDLTIGADLDSVTTLQANDGLANRGVSLFGAGFIVTPAQATRIGLGSVQGLEKHIVHYRHGRDLTDKPRGVLVVDMFGLTDAQVLSQYPAVYQHLWEKVKPERDLNNRPSRRDNWWLFGETNPKLRKMLAALPRYVATVETAKHRFFQFLDASILPDNMLVAIALDDAFYLGVLSSRAHVVWALAAGGTLEDRPRYNKTRCFDPFPFPAATEAQQARIRELAETLDAHRKRQQARHPSLTLTDLYNVVEKLRAGQPLTAKEQITHEHGLAAVVLSLHQQLDAAVAEAYGWPADLPETDILTHLVQLNHARQQEEAAGTIRYLRPAYQAPDEQQATLTLPAAAATPTVAAETGPQPWPAGLAQQMQAVRGLVQQAAQPLSSAQVAARFRGSSAKKVQPLLDTLALMALVRFVEEENKYAA